MSKQDTSSLFRERLNEVIDRSGLTRSAFATRIGVDRSTLSQILSDNAVRLPRVETLTAIASSEHVSIDWLVGLSQDGSIDADILPQVAIEAGTVSESDARLAAWRAEAIGYKIRYVPLRLPDLLKTGSVIAYEAREAATTNPSLQSAATQERLAYQRRPESDMEVCSSVQSVQSFAEGTHLWADLSVDARRAQIEQMIRLTRELYPTFRWFLYDELHRYAAPLTVFGSVRAALYIGQMYVVVTSTEHIRLLTNHFDDLIRSAIVQPTEIPNYLQGLLDRL